MEPIIVTVKVKGETREQDLQLSPDLPIADLVATLIRALGWPNQVYTVEASNSEQGLRRLGDQDTLARAGFWDGSLLTFIPSASDPAPAPPSTSVPEPQPVQDHPAAIVRWRKTPTGPKP